jgi:hypothetical protein
LSGHSTDGTYVSHMTHMSQELLAG